MSDQLDMDHYLQTGEPRCNVCGRELYQNPCSCLNKTGFVRMETEVTMDGKILVRRAIR